MKRQKDSKEYITWKEPQYLTYIKIPKIVEHDCGECGHVEKTIEWVKKGIGFRGYKTKRRVKTYMDTLNEYYAKKWEESLNSYNSIDLLSKDHGKIVFSKYSELKEEENK